QGPHELPLHLLWRIPITTKANPPSAIPTVDARRLYLVTSTVEAYSLEKGELLWRSPLRQYVPRGLLAVNGMVIVPEGVVSALDGRTGREVWEFTPDANTSLGRAAADGQALYFGTASHRLYALRLKDGEKLWETDLGPEWKEQAVVRGVAVAGETV